MKRLLKRLLVINKNVSNLNEHERLKLIHQLDIDKSIVKYVETRLKNLSIKIGGAYEGNVVELMNKGLLEGWCWQTTESSIVFFYDDDCIERGNLTFEKNIGTLGFALHSMTLLGYLTHVCKFSLKKIYIITSLK